MGSTVNETCCLVADDERSLILKKVEPWNSVRVTFNIPADAAERLRELAQHPNSVLRELGVLAVQIGGGHVMSLSVAGNGSNTDSDPSDVVAGTGDQTVCQPTASVVYSSSGKTSGQPTEPSFQQFKVPTVIVPSCCTNALPPPSSAVRTTATDHPVPDVVSNLNVAQPRPVGLVRWPGVIPGRPGIDAVAVRFAVPPVPMKEFSQGLCFISPLRAAISQNIASSSPLLVNLLQAQRQQGINAVPSQPVIPLDTSALVVPQKRRRNTSARKAKQPRNDQEPVLPVTSLQLNAGSASVITQNRILPVATTFATGSRMTLTSDSRMPTENENIADESLTEDTGGTRRMINPYTGNLELVDMAEDDGLSVSVFSSTEISGGCSTQPLIETVAKSSSLLNSDQSVTASGPSNQKLPNFMSSKLSSAAVKTSRSDTCAAGSNQLANNRDSPCSENPTVSVPLVAISAVSTSSRCVDWYTASQSDKHHRVQYDTGQLLFTGGLSGAKQPDAVKSVSFSNITTPSDKSGIGSIDTTAATCSSDERCLSTTKPFCTSDDQPALSYLSNSSTIAVSCLESVRRKTVSDGIPSQSSSFSTSCNAVPQLSTSQSDLIQMAFTLAKQNGSALHVTSLVDSWTKNAGLLQSSLQSLQGLQNIALATASIPFHSSSTATTTSSCAQSRGKDVDGLNRTASVVSSDTCFFPAVSCFPPEHRRKSAVSIGGFGINPEPQVLTGTSSAVSASPVSSSTLPSVKILTATSMPPEVKTCGISFVPSTVSNPVTVSTSISTESNLLSAGVERPPLLNTDIKKSIPLLTNLAPSSWPLMPNLLTVPLVNPTSLSASPLLHCVTRAPLTPDGKLAGLSATVTNAKGSIVPLAGRLCIPLSTPQTASVTTGADKQDTESTVISGIRPHAIMLTDNLTKIKLSVSGNSSKSLGKQSASKDRRGSTARTDDSTAQRGGGKSHLTVAQLLDMAKNARLQQTACDDEPMKTSEQRIESLSPVVTSALLQPQSALTVSPLQLSSLPLQSTSVLLASNDQSQAQLVSVRLSSSAAGSIHTPPTASAVLQTNANPLLSLSTTSSVVSQSAATVMSSTVSSFLLPQPLNTATNLSTVSAHSTSASVDVPGKVSIESAVGNEHLAFNTLSSSVSAPLTMSAYSVQPPLSITSPRYPLNLTESVKKAMRGVGLYPSPPVSPAASIQTFGSSKLPEIRPYPVSIPCSIPVSELPVKKLLQDRSPVTVPVTSQPLLSTAFNCAVVSCTNSYGPSTASVNFTLNQTLMTANNCVSSVCPFTVSAEVTEKQTDVKNGEIVSHSSSAHAHVVPSVISVDSAVATDCILAAQSIRPKSATTECSPYVSIAGAAVTCSFIENSSLHGHAVSSYNSLKDGLHVTKTVSCFNGGLSASSGDSDMELRRDILDGFSSVETDAGLSSLQSSPCSAEMTNVLDSAKEIGVMNCITAVDHRHSRDAVPLNAQSPLCEGSLSLHCDTSIDDGYIKAASLASGVSAASVDVESNKDISTVADSADLPCQKTAADSSVMSSTYNLLKRNRLQSAMSNIGIRSTARRKRPADTNSDVVSGGTLNSAKLAGEQQTVTSVRSVTRMTTRSSRRTAASTTESADATVSNQTTSIVQKTPLNSSEKHGRAALESSNHVRDFNTAKPAAVTQRRSSRTPVAKVMDLKNAEAVTACQDTDSGISLRSHRRAQKVNSVEIVTPRKRAGLRGTGISKEMLCLVADTEDVIGVLDGSTGVEVNVTDHEDNR